MYPNMYPPNMYPPNMSPNMSPNMYADASPSLHVRQRDNLPGVNERIKSAYSNCIIIIITQ